MGSGFGVDPQTIVDHAASLQTNVFSRIDAAVAAAEQVGIGNHEAWGVIFEQLVPPVLEGLLEEGTSSMQSTADFAQALGEALEGTAENYSLVDEEVTGNLDMIAGEIE